MRSRVVLPLPLAPMILIRSPGAARRLMAQSSFAVGVGVAEVAGFNHGGILVYFFCCR